MAVELFCFINVIPLDTQCDTQCVLKKLKAFFYNAKFFITHEIELNTSSVI
jgi:hypothetical protein